LYTENFLTNTALLKIERSWLTFLIVSMAADSLLIKLRTIGHDLLRKKPMEKKPFHLQLRASLARPDKSLSRILSCCSNS